jgi:acetyltransferase-like isoleucine patch superfamily enzyme
MSSPRLTDYVARFTRSVLAEHATLMPWELTARAAEVVMRVLATADAAFEIAGDIARHPSARVEHGAIVKGPAVIGPGCLVAAGAYLRGGVWLEDDCVVGPHAEVKTSSSSAAHGSRTSTSSATRSWVRTSTSRPAR